MNSKQNICFFLKLSTAIICRIVDVDNVDNSVGNSFLAKICHFCMLITLWVFC